MERDVLKLALKLVLRALDDIANNTNDSWMHKPQAQRMARELIKPIETALAQPAQEPVEYQMLILGGRWTHCAKHIYDAADKSIVRALYTTPPKRPWVGLTDDERECIAEDYNLIGYKSPFKEIEQALKEKNNGA
jgi:hypothetical protein